MLALGGAGRRTEGGKRFRPALVIATHDALAGTCPGAAVEVGAAVELLHTAFVIHDDVIDGDDLRRGRLNVSGTFRAQALSAGAAPHDADEFGRTAGILAGDLALAAAIRAVATCGAPTEVVHRLLDLFDAALHTSAAGELADVRLSLGLEEASLSQSLSMEEQKTAPTPSPCRCRPGRCSPEPLRPRWTGSVRSAGCLGCLPAGRRPDRRVR
jgi:geranylgeranyl diphosphate synthase type II